MVFLSLLLITKIQQRFQQGVHQQAAQLYARPITLSPTTSLTKLDVIALLDSHGYQPSNRASRPGQYVVADTRMDVHLLSTGEVAATPIRLHFVNDQLRDIQNHQSGQSIAGITLEPERIGSLQLGPYEDRLALKLHQMPESLIRALLAMEDRNFEQHVGVDPFSIFRALFNNLMRGRAMQGGSTITQQLVKNLFLSPERSLSRKSLEALMAIVVELRYSKAEILQHYLNEIFLGQAGNRAVHGFAMASEFYFARPLDQLRLHEIATLVGIVPAPSFFNPKRHPERALSRRNIVIDTLQTLQVIDQQTADALQKQPLGVANHKQSNVSEFPTYVDYLHRQIRQYFPEDVLRRGRT